MPPKASSSTSGGKRAVNKDWNVIWASKNLADLAAIPIHAYGFCGCPLCGDRRAVKGSTFVAHMRELHAPKTVTYKRARTTTVTPAPSDRPSLPPPQPFAESSSTALSRANQLEAMDVDDAYTAPFALDSFAAGSSRSNTPDALDTETSRLLGAVADETQEEGTMEGGMLNDDIIRGALNCMFEYTATDDSDLPAVRPITPEPVDEAPAPMSPGVYAGFNATEEDFLDRIPMTIPRYMKEPIFSGARPNPHVSNTTGAESTPVLLRMLPVLAHALTGLYGVARRPINLALQVATIVVRNAENRIYQRFRQWYLEQHPEASATVLEDLESLNPAFDPPAAPNTLETALRRIGVNTSTIVHPVCPYRECFNIFYATTTREGFVDLPQECPECQGRLFGTDGQSIALHFARRSLKDELEAVLSVRGVEEALDQRQERKRARDDEDDRAAGRWGRVYRQQDDGNDWEDTRSVAEGLRDALQLTANLNYDTAQASSRRSAATNSIGPIVLQLADLPAQLRSSFACMMVMGITPGPKAPTSSNLYKFLLPLALEIRDAEANGIWLQTPGYPQGRLARLRLGIIVCDRPAAVEVTGGPYYGALTTPCLRCTIQSSEIIDLSAHNHPLRDSQSHNRAIFNQLRDLPAFLAQHKETYQNNQQALLASGAIQRLKPYTKAMREEAIASINVFAGHISALAIIPGYDKFGKAIFDPMHSLLEGLVKTYFHKVLVSGKHGSAGDEQLASRQSGERDGDSAGETEWGSDTEAVTGQSVAMRVIAGLEKGEVVIPTKAELKLLRQGVKNIGKKARKGPTARLGDSGVARLQQLLSNVYSPSSIPNLHPEFGSPSAGTPTASHWKAFASVYAPLTIPLLFHERGNMDGSSGNSHLTPAELQAMMLLFELVSLALRTSMSDTLLDRLRTLINTFLSLAFSLHPTLHKSTNFHVVTHLADDIQRFGPSPGWWTFPTERINYVIKNANQSGANRYQAGTLGLRAVVKAKQMVSARLNAFHLGDSAEQLDRDLVEELSDTFDAFHHDGAADTLEQISLRYAEIDRLALSDVNSLSSRSLMVKPRGASQERTLDDVTLAQLQDCLRKFGQQTRSVLDIEEGDPSLDYLPSRAVFWQGVIFGTRRLDAAEWSKPLNRPLDRSTIRNLVVARNALFESRRESKILDGDDGLCVTAVLCAVFEHKASGPDGASRPPRLFGIIRKLKAYTGVDPYGYRQHPSLGVWLWEQSILEDPVILWLNPSTLESLRPLAVTSLPKVPNGDEGQAVWATIPVPYH